MVVAVGGESDGSCLLLVLAAAVYLPCISPVSPLLLVLAAAVRLVARLTSLHLPCISPVSHHVSL